VLGKSGGEHAIGAGRSAALGDEEFLRSIQVRPRQQSG
jgi:hypothetical protein